MDIERIKQTADAIGGEIAKVLVGKEQATRLLLAAYFAGGHVLLEDLPGTGKTMLAKSLAGAVGGEFKRIQFTPDLLPTDVTGLNFFDQKQGEFVFRQGPVFANIVLADEINRATPRTQSSLLESMEERQVSIDGETMRLPAPFFVIATQNPIEALGTFPLPEAQLDRFMLKLSVGFPRFSQELEMMERYRKDTPLAHLQKVCTVADVLEIQREVCEVYVHPEVGSYLLQIVTKTREDDRVLAGASPRATLALMRVSQAYAAIGGRAFVTPDDVKDLAPYVLAHRLVYASDAGLTGGYDLVRELTDSIEPPVEPFGE